MFVDFRKAEAEWRENLGATANQRIGNDSIHECVYSISRALMGIRNTMSFCAIGV